MITIKQITPTIGENNNTDMKILLKDNIYFDPNLSEQSDEVKSTLNELKQNCNSKLEIPFKIDENFIHPFLMEKVIFYCNTVIITETYTYYPEFGLPNFADQTITNLMVEQNGN